MRLCCLLVAFACPTITSILLRTSHEVALSTGSIYLPNYHYYSVKDLS
jgi:hypothetical protein